MKIGIIGAGIMGRGIAQVAIKSDFSTVMVDISDDALENAVDEINKYLQRDVDKGRIEQDDLEKIRKNLETGNDINSYLDDLSIVIEAVPENVELKQRIINQIHDRKEVIVASNTSSISIDKLAEVSNHPSKVIGMHFFNPPAVMKLVEIIIGEKTSKETKNKVTDLAKQMDKQPIHVKDFPGFASSRLGVTLGLEAIRMLEQGVASAEDIDKAMTLGYRHPMGPLELTDYIGLDTRLKIAKYLNEAEISPTFDVPELLINMVNEGKLGRKSGEGFYEWKDGKRVVK